MGWGIRSTYSRGPRTFRGRAAWACSRSSNFARSYRRHLKGCGRVAAHAGFCCCATPVPGNRATPTGAWAWGMPPKFENRFPPVAAPKATPTCGRGRHNPTSGVTKPRPRSCCMGGAVHREETAEWAWFKPVVWLGHAPESHLTKPRPRRCRVGGAISLAVRRVWPKLIASKLCTPLAPPRNTLGKNTLHIRTLLLKCCRPHPVSFRPRVRGKCCGV